LRDFVKLKKMGDIFPVKKLLRASAAAHFRAKQYPLWPDLHLRAGMRYLIAAVIRAEKCR
jgi:hypothetical protein